MGKYYPVPMHIHSAWERVASMEGHFYNAKRLGIKNMYITDHDIRMGRKKFHIDSFDFSKGVLKIDEPSKDPLRPKFYGFTVNKCDEGCLAEMTDKNEVCLIASSVDKNWSAVEITFDASQGRHEYALLANVILHLGMILPEESKDIQVVVDVKLSQRPPDFEFGHILYVYGNKKGLKNKYSAVKPIKTAEKYALNLLEDAKSVGGGDNVLQTISFKISARRGKTAKLLLNKLSIGWELEFEDARRMQQRLGDKLGRKYGVSPIVTNEITGAGPHKNVFSTCVPVINYRELDYNVSEEYAIEHVISHGGIFARNHPFGVFKDKLKMNPESKNECIKEVMDDLVEKEAYGATLIEVGFPEGRDIVTLDDHLKLWDALSKKGIFITGYGDSDNHSNNANWFEGNNFVGYIYADKPGEEDFVSSMKNGNLYTGDPVYLKNTEVVFEDEFGNSMGSVIYTKRPLKVSFKIKGVKEQMKVLWVLNGKPLKEEYFKGEYTGTAELLTQDKVNFIRVQVYYKDRCIMLTNPIYSTEDKDIFNRAFAERKAEID